MLSEEVIEHESNTVLDFQKASVKLPHQKLLKKLSRQRGKKRDQIFPQVNTCLNMKLR